MRIGMIDMQAIRKRWDTVGSKLDERGQRVFASAAKNHYWITSSARRDGCSQRKTASRGGLSEIRLGVCIKRLR
jgi:hypothetical protein